VEDQFEDFGFSSIIYLVLHIKMITEILVLVILTGKMSAIYPARKALQRTLMNEREHTVKYSVPNGTPALTVASIFYQHKINQPTKINNAFQTK